MVFSSLLLHFFYTAYRGVPKGFCVFGLRCETAAWDCVEWMVLSDLIYPIVVLIRAHSHILAMNEEKRRTKRWHQSFNQIQQCI